LGIPTTTSRILWSTTDEGRLEVLPSPSFGVYAARFTPAPGVHDRRAIIAVAADPDLRASMEIDVETTQTLTATARVGVLTNLSGAFGQTVFLEGAAPLRRKSHWARLLRLGLTVGYIHSGFTHDVPPGARMSSDQLRLPTGIRLSLNQVPLLAFLRLHVPTPRLPVGLSISGFAGYARAWSEIIETTEGTQSHPGANLAMVGLGTDLAFRLRPGQVVFGVRYIATNVARLSTGDLLIGNAGGLLFDFGFRLHQ